VATGYGEGRPRRRELEQPGVGEFVPRQRPPLREPNGELRVSRRAAVELDVPEFIPRR